MFTVPMESIWRLIQNTLLYLLNQILLQLWQNEVAFNTYRNAGE